MRILRGEHRGKTATLHQFANDWMTVDIDGGPTSEMVKPTAVQLTEPEEFAQFEACDADQVGVFFQLWKLWDDGTFQNLHPEPAGRAGDNYKHDFSRSHRRR